MDRWRGKVAVVTGASSGIGSSICQRLVQGGLQVVGLARRKEKVEELAGKFQSNSDGSGKLFAMKADVSQENEVLSAFKWIKSNLGPVHILINNAGVLKPTDLINGDSQLWKTTLDTNIFGTCLCTREAIKSMEENKIDGHIIHVNSIAGHKVIKLPHLNVYGASKYAVTALAETLRAELNKRNSKIKITSVSPGLVSTNIFSDNNFSAGTMREIMEGTPILQPDDITEGIIYVLSTPPHVNVQELIIKPIGETL